LSALPIEIQSLPAEQLSLVINDIRNIADGIIVSEQPEEFLLSAAAHFNQLKATGFLALAAVIMSACGGGLALSMRYIGPDMRARIKVERTIRGLMILCSTIAIFTTIGIILSVLFESIRFFNQIPATDFLFGLKWSPQMAIRACSLLYL
jgi:phosphate transport system permease protein